MVQVFLSDPHIDEASIDELDVIFREIFDKYDGNELYLLGDYYNKKHPTPLEITFGTKWMAIFKGKYKRVFALTGNHEEIDKKCSTIEYLQYLGIRICTDEITIHTKTLEVDKYMQQGIIILGHFFIDKSNKVFTKYRYCLKDIENDYDYILLGHQHGFQKMSEKAYHLGSIRYITFNELEDNCKHIALIKDGKIEFPILNSVIPMIEVFDSDKLPIINPRTKVRLTVKSFEQFKREVNNFDKWRKRFTNFKVKLDFEEMKTPENGKDEKEQFKSMKDRVNEWFKRIKDEDVKNELKEVFK